MRVLYLIKSFDFGGAENHVLDLANSMDDSGNEVFIISRNGLQSKLLNKNVKFIHMKMTDLLIPFQVIFICWIAARNRIEIMHAHKRLAILQASLAGRIMQIPVVATVHGRTRHDLRSLIARKMTDRLVFVNGKTIKANIHRRDFRNKSVLIHNGVRVESCSCTCDPSAILYICRVDRKHAEVISMIISEVLPGIIREFPDVTFTVAGDGRFIGSLRDEAESLNAGNEKEVCRFIGYVQDIRSVVCRSGVVLGVGRVALEALSCSRPVISLNRLFLGQIITTRNFDFYRLNNFVAIDHEKPDPQKLKSMVRDYLKDPGYWHHEASHLCKLVSENLSLEKITADIMSLYMEACSSGKNNVLKPY